MKGPFDNKPHVKGRRLPLLPENPHPEEEQSAVGAGHFPPWLHRPFPKGNALWKTHDVLNTYRLPTVCEEAKCPNLPECYSQKTATFLAMGHVCTRNCGFCSIDFSVKPSALEADEPERLAASVHSLGLKHVVITMVARDDLADGGAGHLVAIINTVRKQNPDVTIEILTSDFEGNRDAIDIVLAASPEIFNHNIETVRRLSPRVRHKATYERTLAVLAQAKTSKLPLFVKSGLMVGLGETKEEVQETLRDLHAIGCDIVTIGHYLQPTRNQLRLKAFISPETFDDYAAYGKSIGIPHLYAGPFVRSSYNAASLFNKIQNHA